MMIPLPERLGAVLKSYRIRHTRLDRADFARKVGFSYSHLASIEEGAGYIKLSTLQTYCRAINVPMWKVIQQAENNHIYDSMPATGG